MVLGRVRVVSAAGTRNQRVQFAEHEQEHAELVSWGWEVNKDDLAQKEASDLHVRPVVGAAENDAELVAEVVETLGTSLQVPDLLTAKQELDTVSKESVVVLALNETFENFLV